MCLRARRPPVEIHQACRSRLITFLRASWRGWTLPIAPTRGRVFATFFLRDKRGGRIHVRGPPPTVLPIRRCGKTVRVAALPLDERPTGRRFSHADPARPNGNCVLSPDCRTGPHHSSDRRRTGPSCRRASAWLPTSVRWQHVHSSRRDGATRRVECHDRSRRAHGVIQRHRVQATT